MSPVPRPHRAQLQRNRGCRTGKSRRKAGTLQNEEQKSGQTKWVASLASSGGERYSPRADEVGCNSNR
ncbi:MAG: hypothetical protein ACPGXX_08770, partial [Planctomycetaceae bacterium]